MAAPVVQVYDMSDADTQGRVLELLEGRDDVAARLAFNGPDHYLVVECGDPGHAYAIFTMVTTADPRATLIHSTDGAAPEFDRPLELELD